MLFRYIVATLIGAAIAIPVGYLIYAAPGEAVSFGYWLSRPIRFGVLPWAAAGAVVSAAVYFLATRR